MILLCLKMNNIKYVKELVKKLFWELLLSWVSVNTQY